MYVYFITRAKQWQTHQARGHEQIEITFYSLPCIKWAEILELVLTTPPTVRSYLETQWHSSRSERMPQHVSLSDHFKTKIIVVFRPNVLRL